MIGVFDSGFGGLTVLRHLRRALPRRDFVYLGDSGRAPYGGRDVDTILDFSEQAVERLFEEGCRLVVVACNTVSCVALRHLQQRYCPPGATRRVLGVTIPAAEAAVRRSAGHVGILATARTVASQTYVTEMAKLGSHRVTQKAAPLLVPIVEEGWEETDLATQAVARYVAELAGVDTLLLGCTHYPLLMHAFLAAVPPGVAILDPAPHVAERLVDWLQRHPGFDDEGDGVLRVMCTGDGEAFSRHGQRFLGEPLPPVEHVADVHGSLAHREPGEAPRGQVVRPGGRPVRP
jgi:glutamate racemase